MTGMKRFGELRREAATQPPPASPSTCPLPTTTVEANPENASAPNPDGAAAGERAQVRAIRAEARGEDLHETKGVTVQSLAAVHALAVVDAILDTPPDGILAAEGAMVAVPLNAHHQAAFAVDGRKTVSVPDTTKESASLSTLAPPLLLSLRKEEARSVPQGGLKVLDVERGLTHRIPTTTRTSSLTDTASGPYRADASSVRTAKILTRQTVLQLSAQARKVAIIVQGERARLQRKIHPEANRLRRNPHLRDGHHRLGKRSPPDKAAEENLGGRARTVGQGGRLPVLPQTTGKRRMPRAKSLMMTPLLMSMPQI